MKRSGISLRTHITWILMVKLVVMICLKMTFFSSLEQQHQPVDLYIEPSTPTLSTKERS